MMIREEARITTRVQSIRSKIKMDIEDQGLEETACLKNIAVRKPYLQKRAMILLNHQVQLLTAIAQMAVCTENLMPVISNIALEVNLEIIRS